MKNKRLLLISLGLAFQANASHVLEDFLLKHIITKSALSCRLFFDELSSSPERSIIGATHVTQDGQEVRIASLIFETIKKQECYILRIQVNEKYQRKGIGTELIAYLATNTNLPDCYRG